MSREKLRAEAVRLEYVNKRTHKRLLALGGIDLTVYEGEFMCIVGPSGCGKTTFLNIVSGLTAASSGAVYLDDRRVTQPGPDRAMVFQSASLLPWRTVLGNVMYGLELRKVPGNRAREVAREYIHLVGLESFEGAYPYELSGGMQQRVNLARALAVDPEVILLDEPFAALDAQTREFMQEELLRIWRAAGKTALFITHQINEAVYLADRVCVFGARPGRVREVMPVDLPRPRDLRIKRTPRFHELEDYVWNLIEDEARHGLLISARRAESEPVVA
jgi:NitT/TauT family transport system ATP-binding protein